MAETDAAGEAGTDGTDVSTGVWAELAVCFP